MNRRTAASTSAAAAAALAALAVAVATHAQDTTTTAPPATQQIHLQFHQRYQVHDRPPKGTSDGDTLYDRLRFTGQRRGSAFISCTAASRQYLCNEVIHLAAGDLYVLLAVTNDRQPAAVVGGTKAYLGARGQIAVKEGKNGDGSWTITLLTDR